MSRDILIDTAAVSPTSSVVSGVVSGATAVATAGPSANSVGPPTRAALAEELGQRAGGQKAPPAGWFSKLIAYYLRRYQHKDATSARSRVKDGQSISDAARSRIRRASVKSAISGAAAGTLSTAATLITAQTEGLAGLVAIPIAALGIGGEMMYRSLVHFDLTVQLADLFEVEFDPTDPADIIRLYSLVFKTNAEEEDAPRTQARRQKGRSARTSCTR